MNYKTLLDNWFRGIYTQGYHDAMEWCNDMEFGSSKNAKVHKHEDKTVQESFDQFKVLIEGIYVEILQYDPMITEEERKQLHDIAWKKWLEMEQE